MDDKEWKICLQTCSTTLGRGDWDAFLSPSWCAFTTFASLDHGVRYFNCGFPSEAELLETGTVDGGTWRQAFEYADLAHLIVPRRFYWERTFEDNFESGYKEQDINLLSSKLIQLNIGHSITKLILEIKLF
jgi:hypothetical protein